MILVIDEIIEDIQANDIIMWYLTSSNGLNIFEPSHQVSFGEGYPPTAWHVTSTSLSADTWFILSSIETAVGFTEIKVIYVCIHIHEYFPFPN